MNNYRLTLTHRLLLAAISGAMIFPLSFLEKLNVSLISGVSLVDVLIGVIFAILVMVPFQHNKNWIKSLLMVLASILIYNSMVHLAVSHYNIFALDLNNELAITLSGGLGAILTGLAVQLIAPINLKISAYPMLIIFGLITGYIFSFCIDSSSSLINSLGYIAWQVSVCFSIATSRMK